MSIPDFLRSVFERRSKPLTWQWILDDHVVTAAGTRVDLGVAFVASNDYVVLRLSEMYLKRTRILWREFYPLVHAFVSYGDAKAPCSLSAMAGPGQLKDLGSANLDRLIGLAYRLAGPIVYDGQDVEFLVGLYAVPAKDGAKLLVDTLSQLAGLVPALAQASQLAGIVKGAVEGLLGMSFARSTLPSTARPTSPRRTKGRSGRLSPTTSRRACTSYRTTRSSSYGRSTARTKRSRYAASTLRCSPATPLPGVMSSSTTAMAPLVVP